MNDGFLPAFVARWTRMRERYLADPEEHGVKNTRLVKLWERFGGRCHLCGGRVPHPILELDAVDKDNAPTADHAKPRVAGGKCGENLRLAHPCLPQSIDLCGPRGVEEHAQGIRPIAEKML